MFQTTGVVDREALEELGGRIMKPAMRYLMAGAVAVLLITGIYLILGRRQYAGFVELAFAAGLAIEYWVTRKGMVKKFMAQVEQLTGKPEMAYSSYFNEEGMVVRNPETGAERGRPYSDFVDIAKTDRCYVLFPASRSLCFVFRGDFDEDEEADFLAFLKKQDTKIRWDRKKL